MIRRSGSPRRGAEKLGFLAAAALLALTALTPSCGGGETELDRRFRPDPATGSRLATGDFAIETLDLDLKEPLAALESAFEGRDAPALHALLTDGFRGSALVGVCDPGPERVTAARSVAPSEAWADSREAFRDATEAWFENFDYIYEAFFKVKEYSDRGVWTDRADVKVKLDLRAKRNDGGIHQEFVYWRCSLRKIADTWKIDRAFVLEREQIAASRPLFSEVTSSSGLFVAEPPERAIPGLGNIGMGRNPQSSIIYDYGGVCVYDIDGDRDLDIFMPNAYGTCSLFIQGDDGSFTDEARDRGITMAGGARGAVFGDVDSDGDPDLYICRAPMHIAGIEKFGSIFYENVGDGKFTERTRDAGLEVIEAAMTPLFLDYDVDGDLDLFVANYGPREMGADHHPYHSVNGLANRLYQNDGSGHFTDVSREAGLGAETYWSFAAAACDVDGDRDPDLYVANDFGPNHFYLNQGDGTFEECAEELGIEDIGNGMGATFTDWNGDRAWDLYVSNMQSGTGRRVLSAARSRTDREDYEHLWKLTLGNTAFESQGSDGSHNRPPKIGKNRASSAGAPAFASRARDLGIADAGWAWHADFFDFDADGDRDLLVANGYFSGEQKKDC